MMFIIYGGEKKDEGKKIISEVMDSLTYPQGYGWSYGFWTKREETRKTTSSCSTSCSRWRWCTS